MSDETLAVEVLTDSAQIERLIAGTSADAELWAQTNSEDASKAIVARILSAEDEDAVFGMGEKATSADEVIGTPLFLRSVRFALSSYEVGPPVYALLDVADDAGEKLTVSCGSRNVMAQVHQLDKLGKLPLAYPVQIVRADRPTSAGFYPMWLRRWDEQE